MAGKYLHVVTVALVLFGTVLAVGCHRRDHSHKGGGDVKGSGNIVSEDRSVRSFHGVELAGMGTIVIKQGEAESVRVEADDNVIADVSTEVEHGILTVGMKKDHYHDARVKVTVTVEDLDMVRLSGAGDIESDNDLKADDLTCSLTGVGKISLKGTCANLKVNLTGVGSVSNADLVSENCRASVNGVGSAEVNVTGDLDATVTGVGKVSYKGSPRKVNKSVSGLGGVDEL